MLSHYPLRLSGSRTLRRTERMLRAIALLLATGACRQDPVSSDGTSEDPVAYNADWTQASHGKSTPDYSVAFPQSSVNTIEIVMTAAKWSAIRANMRSLWGYDFGAGNAGPRGGPGGFPSQDPDYVDVTLTFNGKKWKNVGFRLKGNSSLGIAWGQGIYKVPFRLDFDEFEDSIPAVTDQRFHGFKELSFSPGFSDNSLIREKTTADIFRAAGIPAAQTAFYRVYIDFGAGLKYAGVYTAVEVIDDTMIKTQFGGDAGNIYKPEATFASFSAAQFEKKNNEAAADYSDVQATVAALNSTLRTTDRATWRRNLEAVFNVDHFLKWLAVNNTIVNWDSYGAMAHNYYLYNDPSKKLTWIPWDHNMSMTGSPGVTGSTGGGIGGPGGPGGPGFGGMGGLSLSMNEVTSSWPLIRYLIDDPTYLAAYKGHMRRFVDETFTVAAMDALLAKHHAMIAPYAVGTNGEQSGYTYLSSAAAFTQSLSDLQTHVRNRRSLVASFAP